MSRSSVRSQAPVSFVTHFTYSGTPVQQLRGIRSFCVRVPWRSFVFPPALGVVKRDRDHAQRGVRPQHVETASRMAVRVGRSSEDQTAPRTSSS